HESLRAKRTPESVLKKLDALETVSQAVIVALDELDDSIIRSGIEDETSLSEE
ncbi:hypothetical protein H8467_003653, partial [Salmonella enterica]|nr:hypothetical protein [Salmonella enterica]